LNFFKEPITCLHVYVNNTRTLQRDEFVFLTKDPKMASGVQLKIIANASDYFY
jgi:hypothetical protein